MRRNILITAKMQKCESGNPFHLKGKMDMKCGGPSGMDKVRAGKRREERNYARRQWTEHPTGNRNPL